MGVMVRLQYLGICRNQSWRRCQPMCPLWPLGWRRRGEPATGRLTPGPRSVARLPGSHNQNVPPKKKSGELATMMAHLDKARGGKSFCGFFNMKADCQAKGNCSRKHVCAEIPEGKKDFCFDKHSMTECKKK